MNMHDWRRKGSFSIVIARRDHDGWRPAAQPL